MVYLIYFLLAIMLFFGALYLADTLPKQILMNDERVHEFSHAKHICTFFSIKGFIKDLLSKPYLSVSLAILIFIFAILIAYQYGLSVKGYSFFFFCWALLVLGLIDYQYQLLPDALTLPVMWLGLIMQLGESTKFTGMANAIWGCVIGYLFFRFLNYVFYRLKGVEGLGRGDMKLMAMIGAWFGLIALPVIMFVACILALTYAMGSRFFMGQKVNSYYAFGPWIIFATFLYIL